MNNKWKTLVIAMSSGATLSFLYACAGESGSPTKRDTRTTATNVSQNATLGSNNMVISKAVVSDADVPTAGDGSQQIDDPTKDDSQSKNLDPGSTPTPTPLPTATPAPSTHCNASTLSFVTTTQCPAGNAVFAVDDGTTKNFACCPVSDPGLFVAGAPTSRAISCTSDEVIVGAASNGNVLCAKIDTTKYGLGTAVGLCYYGFGTSGPSGNGPKCVTPPNWLMNATQAHFGADGCYMPSNASILARTQGVAGATCQNFSGVSILNKTTNQPVTVFVP